MMRSKQDATGTFLEKNAILREPQLTEKSISDFPSNRSNEQQAEREDSKEHLHEASLCFDFLQYNGDNFLQPWCVVVPHPTFPMTDTTENMFNRCRN